MRSVLLKPVVSEKALALIESRNTYIFEVSPGSTKQEIAAQVGNQFSVKVGTVNVLNRAGKRKSVAVKRGRQQIRGQRRDVRKAYVRLLKGESIKLFDEPKTGKKQKAKSKKDKS